MPMLFAFGRNLKDFPSDSDSDDPDFEVGRRHTSMDSDLESPDTSTDKVEESAGKDVTKRVLDNGRDECLPSTTTNESAISTTFPDQDGCRPPKGQTAAKSGKDEGLKSGRKRKVASSGRQNKHKSLVNLLSESSSKSRKRPKKEDTRPPGQRRRRKQRRIMVAENVAGSNSMKLLLKKKLPVESEGSDVDDSNPVCSAGLWDRRIPREILLKIFKMAVDMVGVLPLLVTLQQVCPAWKAVAEDVSLWQNVDMSVIKVTEKQLCRWVDSGMLSRVKEINLSNYGANISHHTIAMIVDKCPRLETINLSYNTKLSMETIGYIVAKCEKLRGLDISGTAKTRGLSTTCGLNALKGLFQKRGGQLAQFIMAENIVNGLSNLLSMIPTHLPNIQVLDVSNLTTTSTGSFPLEKIQESCPLLRVLRLANTDIRLAVVPIQNQCKSPGFPALEELSVANVDLNDASLERILKSSKKLTLLDVRNCNGLSVSGLVKIPAWDLTQLYISNCAAANNPDAELIMNKWAHCLKVVDVSWVAHVKAVNTALVALSTYADTPSNIYELDLKGSAVTVETLKVLLENCSKLTKLNLTSCRNLPRGVKKLYQGEVISQLRSHVLAGKFDQLE